MAEEDLIPLLAVEEQVAKKTKPMVVTYAKDEENHL